MILPLCFRLGFRSGVVKLPVDRLYVCVFGSPFLVSSGVGPKTGELIGFIVVRLNQRHSDFIDL